MSLIAKEKGLKGARATQLADLLLSGSVALILALGSATAIAASNLDIDVVDLTTSATADMKELRRPDTATSTDDTNAPHLYLGPRVATIVRDVFGEDESEAATELADPPELTPTSQLSPLVERTEPAPDPAEDGTLSSEEAGYSPLRIHQEMYRTDI